jgi:L-amino acid N-acyltransferase YncA
MREQKEIEIKRFESQHWKEVAEIYRLGLLSRNATFETEVPDFESWNKKFHEHLRWVTLIDNKVVGWAGLLPVSARKVYEGVAELSIYVHPDFNGKGIGKQLVHHLIAESERAGIWTLYASTFPENRASIHLHISNGFREIGYRERIAQLDGKWRDTVLYERRSKVAGI